MPRLKKDNDLSPPSREGEVIAIDDDDDDEEESQPPPPKYAATYGASFSSLLFNNNNDGLQTLPPGWKMYPTTATDRKKYPQCGDVYYDNSITNKYK